MALSLRCPKCRQTFPWADPAKGFPDECELCGEYIGSKGNDEVSLPAFLSPKTKRSDDVYRQTEKGSETRVQLAAEAAGCSPEDMSSLKITNLNDRRDAETMAIAAPVNAVTQHMAAMNHTPWRSNGAEYSGQVQSGPFPNAGAKTRTAIQSQHAQMAGSGAVSDRPALEVLQPGYRRRG